MLFRSEVKKYLKDTLNKTTDGVTFSGLDKLDKNTSYLFVSNHRDIAGLLGINCFHVIYSSKIVLCLYFSMFQQYVHLSLEYLVLKSMAISMGCNRTL